MKGRSSKAGRLSGVCTEARHRFRPPVGPCRRALFALMAVCGLMTGIFGGSVTGGTALAAADTKLNGKSVSFPDVTADDWYYEYVMQLAADGYVRGRDTGLYDPQGKLTVAEASTMIVRYLGLEEQAEKKKADLVKNKRLGSELWYAGYMQIMYEAGLIAPDEYRFNVRDGEIMIGEETLFGSYITREAFARLVNGSFALDETQVRSNTSLDPGRLGHGFETEYTYNDTTVAAYADAIADFDDIPQKAREAVLRTYMNGIFQGDHMANFNPSSNLTRAEMAKVITVILHKDMRTFAEVILPASAPVDDEPKTPDEPTDTEEDPASPVNPGEELTREQIDAVLKKELAGAHTVKKNDGTGEFEFRPQNSVPEGYSLRIYHFVGSGGGYDSDLAAPLDNDAGNYYRCAFFGGDRIVLALENTATGETVGTLLLTLGTDGKLIDNTEQYLP